MDKQNIGVIGIGRFGLAIAKILSNNSQITLHLNDSFIGKARQAAKSLNCSFNSADEIIKQCGTIILCMPGKEVLSLLDKHHSLITAETRIIDHSTDHGSEYIFKHIKQKQHYRYIGLRPITQANAMSKNLPIIFISESTNSKELSQLNLIYGDNAQIVFGNESMVTKINEFITYKTLEVFSEAEKYLRQINMHEKIPVDAIKAIVVGTAQDHPDNNSYITNIIQKYGLTLDKQ